MEGERGKLRQSLEELQRLHSQVSTPSSAQCKVCRGSCSLGARESPSPRLSETGSPLMVGPSGSDLKLK